MPSETDSNNLTDFHHSSARIREQASPSVQVPAMERNIDQLIALSEKLRCKTVPTPSVQVPEMNIDQLIVLLEKVRPKTVPTVVEVLGKSDADTRQN